MHTHRTRRSITGGKKYDESDEEKKKIRIEMCSTTSTRRRVKKWCHS